MTGRAARRRLVAGVTAAVLALVASLLTGGRLGGWPLAVAAVGVLPFLLMAWGADAVAGGGGGARTAVLAVGALWVTGCLAAVFFLAGSPARWGLLGLPAQLAVLLLLLGVGPSLLLGLGHGLTFEADADLPDASRREGRPQAAPAAGADPPGAGAGTRSDGPG